MKNKVETLSEYLQRGGIVNKLPTQTIIRQPDIIRKVSTGPITILTLDEADLFYGEARKSSKVKKTKASSTKIDLNALPEALKVKFINKLKEEGLYGEIESKNLEEDEECDDEE